MAGKERAAPIGHAARDDFTPIACPVRRVLIAIEEFIDLFGPFIGAWVLEEIRDIGWYGQSARHIEIDSANELFVAGLWRRLLVCFLKLGTDQPIHFARFQRGCRELKPASGV